MLVFIFSLSILNKSCFGVLRTLRAGEAVGVSFSFLVCLGGFVSCFSFSLIASL